MDAYNEGRRWRRPLVVAGVAVTALAAGAGAGYTATHSLNAKAADTAAVATAPSGTSPTPSAGPGSKNGHGWRGFGGGLGPVGLGLGPGGVVHGQVTVPKSGGGYQTLDVQTGTVTAVSPSSLTVKSADGFSASYAVTSNTIVDAKSAGIGSVKNGDKVFVTATVSGSTATAATIIDVTAVKAGRTAFGFPFHGHKPPASATPAPTQS
jgi:hypothetical protein